MGVVASREYLKRVKALFHFSRVYHSTMLAGVGYMMGNYEQLLTPNIAGYTVLQVQRRLHFISAERMSSMPS